MLITLNHKEGDPAYPIMQGGLPAAKEFNKRMKALWLEDKVKGLDVTIINTILQEMWVDEYNKRHAPRKKKTDKS